MAKLVVGYYDGTLGRRCLSRKFLNQATRALRRYHGDAAEQGLRAAMKKVRPYASFFKWTNKVTEELGIARTLIDSAGGALPLSDLRPGGDPPDVECLRSDGARVAIEVTELTDEEAMSHNVPMMRKTVGQVPLERMKQTKVRDWDKAVFLEAVEERLKAKDTVKLKGGPFEEYVVVLHTDEPMLVHADAVEWLQGCTFTRMGKVTSAYLLFSYDGNGYPYIRLPISA